MSTTAGHTSPRKTGRLASATALLSVAALALAGCSPAGQRDDENGQVNIDPSGAEDQGNQPEEIAADEDDQQAGDLTEIEDTIWEASLDQESVNIEATGGLAQGEQWYGFNPELVQDQADRLELSTTGELEGDSVTELNYTSDYQVLSFGDESYQSISGFVLDYEAQMPAEVDAEVEADELEAALQAEGEWVAVSDSELAVPRTPAAFIESLREKLHETLGVSSLGELELEGTVDTQQGENVWVYSDERIELVVAAESEEPILMGVTLFGEEDDLEISLTEWNEAETSAEEPEEDTVITEEQLQEILGGFV